MHFSRPRSRDLAIVLAALPVLLLAVLWVALLAHGHAGGTNIFATIARLYFAGTIVFPIALLASSAAALAAWRVRRRRCFAAVALGLFLGALAVLAVRVYATHVEPYRLQIRTVTIASPKIRSPIRIVHVSDIQSAAIGPYERRAFETIRALKPDLVLNTGDLLQPVPPESYASLMPEMDRLLRSLAPPLGVFNVPGDTDYALLEPLRRGFGAMKTLMDEEATLDCKGTRLRLFGMSLNTSAGHGDRTVIDRWLSSGVPPSGGVQPEPFTILFGHRPDFIMQVQRLPIDLCLAGHTHGGQVRIPFYGPLMTACRIPRELAWGFHEVGATRLNVSAAVGCEHLHNVPPLRLNCPPELVVIDLIPQ